MTSHTGRKAKHGLNKPCKTTIRAQKENLNALRVPFKNDSDKTQTYVGVTQNLDKRIQEHNLGQSRHTSKYTPWSLEMFLAFQDKQKAYEFEKYLKSHSGKAFANKRFW